MMNHRDFGTICVCAERYACGRETNMPEIVQRFIKANISLINSTDIKSMIADIEHESKTKRGLGDPHLDAPGWVRFMEDLKIELNRREES